MLVARIDDVSINTDRAKLLAMIDVLLERFNCRVICGISPIVFDNAGAERVFPPILKALSDHREFYKGDRIGVPPIRDDERIIAASHGLVHVDHRLLSREAQEMSILISCSIIQTRIFIPPWNHWNNDTKEICREHGIELVKFEDGWKHLRYQRFGDNDRVYFHTHDFSIEEFRHAITG